MSQGFLFGPQPNRAAAGRLGIARRTARREELRALLRRLGWEEVALPGYVYGGRGRPFWRKPGAKFLLSDTEALNEAKKLEGAK